MKCLSIADLSDLSQIAIALLTLIVIIVSMWLSVKALREVQTDRKLRQKPYLGFEIGGYHLSVKFVKTGKRIPGINPQYVEKMFPNLPEDAESVRLKEIDKKDGTIDPLF